MKFKNITGQRFGRLLAIERVENNRHGHPMWTRETARFVYEGGKGEKNVATN